MTTLTVYSSAADGYIESYNADYATARAGSNLARDISGTSLIAGQINGAFHNVYESGVDFDASALTAAASVSSALMTLTILGTTSTTGKIFQARLHDWGTELTTADYVPGADLAAKTLLASYTSDGAGSGAVVWVDSAMAANVNKTGVTRFLLVGKDTVDGNPATAATNEYIQFKTAETAGTTDDPKLVVEYSMPTVAASAFNRLQRRSRVRFR